MINHVQAAQTLIIGMHGPAGQAGKEEAEWLEDQTSLPASGPRKTGRLQVSEYVDS